MRRHMTAAAGRASGPRRGGLLSTRGVLHWTARLLHVAAQIDWVAGAGTGPQARDLISTCETWRAQRDLNPRSQIRSQ